MPLLKNISLALSLVLAAGSLVLLPTPNAANAAATPDSMKNSQASASTCVGKYGDLTKQPAKNQAVVTAWEPDGKQALAKEWKNATGKDLIGRVPIIMIHGWTGHASSFNEDANIESPGKPKTDLGGTAISLASKLRNAVIYTFDYHNVAADWVDNPDSGGAFRTVLNCLNQVTQQRAIVVTHSMGGLVTRYALDGKDRWVSRVITYNTPETGSVIARAITDQINATADEWKNDPGAYWSLDFKNKVQLTGAANLTRLVLTFCGNEAGKSLDGDFCRLDSWKMIEAIGAGMTPAANALLAGSKEITSLAPWPAGLPVDAMAGDQTFDIKNITAGFFDNTEALSTFDLGDIVVSPSSAIAGSSSHNMIKCTGDLTFRDTTFWNKFTAKGMIDRQLQTADVFTNAASAFKFMGGPCMHANAMKSTEQTSKVVTAIAKQVDAQSQIVTYSPSESQNYGTWYAGFNGIGPYRIGQNLDATTAAYKKIYPAATGINYSQSIAASVQRAYDTRNASFGGITGDMLACSQLSDYGIVAARYRTPTVDGNVNQSAYNSRAKPATNSTLSELIVSADSLVSPQDYKYRQVFPQTSIGAITIGTPLKTIVETYGSARLMNVAAAKDSSTGLTIKRYTVTSNVMNANGNLLPSYLNFFVGSQNGSPWRVMQITAGTDQPHYYTADTCTDLDRPQHDAAGYNAAKPNDITAWTLGFEGAGPIKYADGESLAQVSKSTGADYHNSTVPEYSRFGNFALMQKNYPDLIATVHADYMSEYHDSDEAAWQRQEKNGLNLCTPLYPDSTASLAANFAFPFIRSAKTADWLKLDPYGTSHVTDLAVSGSSNGLSTGSGPGSLGNYFMLPRTSAGLGLGSTLTDIRAAYADKKYTVRDWVLPEDVAEYSRYSATNSTKQRLVIVENSTNAHAPAMYFLIEGHESAGEYDMFPDKVFAYGVTTDLYKYQEFSTFGPCVSYSY